MTLFKQKAELKIIYICVVWKDSIVCIVSRLWAGRCGILFPTGQEVFLQNVRTASVASRPSYSVGTMMLRSWVKQLGGEPGHSPPSSTEVKSVEQYILKLENVCRVQHFWLVLSYCL